MKGQFMEVLGFTVTFTIIMLLVALFTNTNINQTQHCEHDCIRYDAEYMRYSSNDLSTKAECWCNKDNEPMRIWWIEK